MPYRHPWPPLEVRYDSWTRKNICQANTFHLSFGIRLDVYSDESSIVMIVVQHILLRERIFKTPSKNPHGTGKKLVEFFQEREQFIQSKERQLLASQIFASKFWRHLSVKPKTGGGCTSNTRFFQRVIPSVSGSKWFALEQKMGLSISEKTCKTYSTGMSCWYLVNILFHPFISRL